MKLADVNESLVVGSPVGGTGGIRTDGHKRAYR